jgi:hypothetical protein
METTIDGMATEKLKKQVAEAIGHLEKAIEALPFLLSLTTDARQHTNGKIRHGEEAAIAAEIETVAKHPAPFASLKIDPKALTALAEKRAALAPLAERAQHLADDLTDTLLHLGEALKTPLERAYHVGAALAPSDAAIARTLAPALSFYQAVGRAAARTRRAHAAAPDGAHG